jgi:hypothetical protein
MYTPNHQSQEQDWRQAVGDEGFEADRGFCGCSWEGDREPHGVRRHREWNMITIVLKLRLTLTIMPTLNPAPMLKLKLMLMLMHMLMFMLLLMLFLFIHTHISKQTHIHAVIVQINFLYK